jgi:hypothetical protein
MFGFDDDTAELETLFKAWADETKESATKKAQFSEFMAKLDRAKLPFRAQERALLEQKRRRDRNATLSSEELDSIWRPFRAIQRNIEHEVYGS